MQFKHWQSIRPGDHNVQTQDGRIQNVRCLFLIEAHRGNAREDLGHAGVRQLRALAAALRHVTLVRCAHRGVRSRATAHYNRSAELGGWADLGRRTLQIALAVQLRNVSCRGKGRMQRRVTRMIELKS